jgi:hypothetical protein
MFSEEEVEDSMDLVEIRKNALFVKVSHYRWIGEKGVPMLLLSAVDIRANGLTHLMLAKGGATKFQVVYADGRVQNAHSECSFKDAFCKRTGITECIKRLNKIDAEAVTV